MPRMPLGMILALSFVLATPPSSGEEAASEPSAFDKAMKRGNRALENEDWTTAAQSFGLALREKPADLEAARLFKEAIRHIEIYNTRVGALKHATMESYGVLECEASIQAGLAWLARHQEADGHWVNHATQGHAKDDLAPTALALLAFLADGSCEAYGPHQEAVRSGVAWILARQNDQGSYGGVTHYSEGLAALAIVEAFAMGGTDATFISAQKSLNYIVSSRCPKGGWLYNPSAEEANGDVSVSGMMFQPLKQAQMAYLDFSYDTLREFADWVARISDEKGIAPYRPGQAAPHHAPSLTAIGSLTRLYAGDTQEASPQLGLGVADVLARREEMRQSMYFLYYGTMLAFLAGREAWTPWRDVMLPYLAERQIKGEGDDRGLFFDENEYWVKLGYMDRGIYHSMALLSLECAYRYVPRPMVPVDED